MIKAILFDLDNTLMNFLWMKEKAVSNALFSMIDSEELNISHKEALKEVYEIFSKTHMEDPKVFTKFLEKHNVKNVEKVLAKGIVSYRKTKSANMLPYPGVRRTLYSLKAKGIKLGIVSDAPKKNAWRRLVELGLEDFFDFVQTYDDCGVHKPSNIPFKSAKEKLGLDYDEILFIGDNPKRDIIGAREVGMKTGFARYGYYTTMFPNRPKDEFIQDTIKEVNPDFIFEKFEDINRVV